MGEAYVHRFLLSERSYSIEIEPRQNFSLFAIALRRGHHPFSAQYGLENEALSMGSQGLHNVATSSTFQVRFTEGRLMLLMRRPSSEAEEMTG